MEFPAQIEFEGIEPSQPMRDAIEIHITQLEQRFGRITTCRVIVKAPAPDQHAGGLYQVHIRLGLPDGREVDIGRTPGVDDRYTDLEFAVNNAFKRARRRLQDQARRIQGHVKTHEGALPIGTVTRLDPGGEFGFLESADGREIYFHRNSVLDDAFPRLVPGTRVGFFEEAGEKGPQASTVRLVGKHKMRTSPAPRPRA